MAQSQYLVDCVKLTNKRQGKNNSRNAEPPGGNEVSLSVNGIAVVVGNFKYMLGNRLLEQGHVRAMPESDGQTHCDREWTYTPAGEEDRRVAAISSKAALLAHIVPRHIGPQPSVSGRLEASWLGDVPAMDAGELEPRRRVLLVYSLHLIDGQHVEIEDILVLHERA